MCLGRTLKVKPLLSEITFREGAVAQSVRDILGIDEVVDNCRCSPNNQDSLTANKSTFFDPILISCTLWDIRPELIYKDN